MNHIELQKHTVQSGHTAVLQSVLSQTIFVWIPTPAAERINQRTGTCFILVITESHLISDVCYFNWWKQQSEPPTNT